MLLKDRSRKRIRKTVQPLKKKVLIHAPAEMNSKNMPSERSQTQETTYWMALFL